MIQRLTIIKHEIDRNCNWRCKRKKVSNKVEPTQENPSGFKLEATQKWIHPQHFDVIATKLKHKLVDKNSNLCTYRDDSFDKILFKYWWLIKKYYDWKRLLVDIIRPKKFILIFKIDSKWLNYNVKQKWREGESGEGRFLKSTLALSRKDEKSNLCLILESARNTGKNIVGYRFICISFPLICTWP